MHTVTRQMRSGFVGIEILLVLVVFAVIFGVIRKCATPADSPKADTGTAQTMTEAARAGSAVLRLSRDADAAAPAVDAPAVDSTATAPSSGIGVMEVIQDFFEGLF